MLDDYIKTNPVVKDFPRPGIEPQLPSPQSDAITIRPWRPHLFFIVYSNNMKRFFQKRF